MVTISTGVLLAELVMSADRLISSAKAAVPQNGQWPPHVILGHIALNDRENWSGRVTLMATSDPANPPEFTWFEPPAEQVEAEFADSTMDECAATLMAQRTMLVGQLRELTDAQWEHTGLHPVFGTMTVRDLVLRVLAHDEEHRGDLVLPSGGKV